MLYTISSDTLTAQISDFGAELSSLKTADGTELIWQADPEIWKRHAPLLFPFICNTESKKYTVNGAEYALSNHGFARDTVFECVSEKSEDVCFVLKSSEETLKKYPYKFELSAEYILSGNTLTTSVTVKNTDDKDIFFFIGGHPAFNCPMTDGDNFDDYYVEYSENETITQPVPSGERTILDNGRQVPLTHELFAHDVFMKDKPNSSSISLKSKKSSKAIRLDYDNSGCIAVWSPARNDANFVCLEPWSSVPVYCDKVEELTEMPSAKKLAAGESYVFSYKISLLTE